ncbi:hypothetical protein T492DRAFT_909764 [Pavlovales sp. CCMP2436]|nr:hypothetical protein T492DRAFT_909764 [Pavlovales sp. CCMP2436]
MAACPEKPHRAVAVLLRAPSRALRPLTLRALALLALVPASWAAAPRTTTVVPGVDTRANGLSLSLEAEAARRGGWAAGSLLPALQRAAARAEAADGTRAVRMRKKDGRLYLCHLPLPLTPDESMLADPANADAVAAAAAETAIAHSAAAVATYLQPLAGTCFYRLKGWWTYEVCMLRSVHQFYQEKHAVFTLGAYWTPDGMAEVGAGGVTDMTAGGIASGTPVGTILKIPAGEKAKAGAAEAGGQSWEGEAKAFFLGELVSDAGLDSKATYYKQVYGNGTDGRGATTSRAVDSRLGYGGEIRSELRLEEQERFGAEAARAQHQRTTAGDDSNGSYSTGIYSPYNLFQTAPDPQSNIIALAQRAERERGLYTSPTAPEVPKALYDHTHAAGDEHGADDEHGNYGHARPTADSHDIHASADGHTGRPTPGEYESRGGESRGLTGYHGYHGNERSNPGAGEYDIRGGEGFSHGGYTCSTPGERGDYEHGNSGYTHSTPGGIGYGRGISGLGGDGQLWLCTYACSTPGERGNLDYRRGISGLSGGGISGRARDGETNVRGGASRWLPSYENRFKTPSRQEMTLERSRCNDDRTNEMRDTRVATEAKSLQKPLEKALEYCRSASQLSDMAHSVADAATSTRSTARPGTSRALDQNSVAQYSAHVHGEPRYSHPMSAAGNAIMFCDLNGLHDTTAGGSALKTAASSPVVALAQSSSDADIARRLQELTAALSSRHAAATPGAGVYAALAQQECEEQLDTLNAMFRPSAFAIMPDLVLCLRGDLDSANTMQDSDGTRARRQAPHRIPGCRHSHRSGAAQAAAAAAAVAAATYAIPKPYALLKPPYALPKPPPPLPAASDYAPPPPPQPQTHDFDVRLWSLGAYGLTETKLLGTTSHTGDHAPGSFGPKLFLQHRRTLLGM